MQGLAAHVHTCAIHGHACPRPDDAKAERRGPGYLDEHRSLAGIRGPAGEQGEVGAGLHDEASRLTAEPREVGGQASSESVVEWLVEGARRVHGERNGRPIAVHGREALADRLGLCGAPVERMEPEWRHGRDRSFAKAGLDQAHLDRDLFCTDKAEGVVGVGSKRPSEMRGGPGSIRGPRLDGHGPFERTCKAGHAVRIRVDDLRRPGRGRVKASPRLEG